VLTYLTMGALVFGTTIGFGLSAFLVTQEETVQVHGIPDSWYAAQPSSPYDPNDPSLTPEQRAEAEKATRGPTRADCRTFTRVQTVAHTERIWWMLPLNPFVVVADAAPSKPRKVNGYYASGFTPMRWISGGTRMARNGPDDSVKQECYVGDASSGSDSDYVDPFDAALRTAPVWPVGLGFLLLAGAGAAAVAGQRLRTPIRRLPNGTRIA
jgi:hypothetical protein